MFYKIRETTYQSSADDRYRRDRRYPISKRTYGVCTCGEKFLIEEEVLESTEPNHWKTTFHNEYQHCPMCGDPYGNWRSQPSSFWIDGSEEIGDDFSRTGCFLYSWVEAPDGSLTVLKEDMPKESGKHPTPKFIRYEITISPIPVPHVHGIKVDRQAVKVTKANISKALSGVTVSADFRYESGLKGVLGWVAQNFNTWSMPKTVSFLIDYPVLDTVFHKNKDMGYFLAHSIMKDEVNKGERSEKKAYGIPKAVCDLLRDKITLSAAKWAVKTVGTELTVTAIQDFWKICGAGVHSENCFMGFTNFYCGELKTAERQRIFQYLTHDVAVYQGIEVPMVALEILLDYRRMCKDMEIAPDLCPKSLKLQHDMAARNHRLCLDEIQKRKFASAVEKPAYKHLAWTSADAEWSILIPEKPDDLIEEGRKQSHCVGSYVSYITEGTYRICFLRRTENLEKPVLTLTVDQKDCCIFYKGFDNRDATKEEKAALKEWAKVKKLSLSTYG